MEQEQEVTKDKHVRITVEVDGKDKHIIFESSRVTGREIRNKAGAPLSDDLVRLIHGKPSGGNIGLDESAEIHDDDRFLALPTGTVS